MLQSLWETGELRFNSLHVSQSVHRSGISVCAYLIRHERCYRPSNFMVLWGFACWTQQQKQKPKETGKQTHLKTHHRTQVQADIEKFPFRCQTSQHLGLSSTPYPLRANDYTEWRLALHRVSISHLPWKKRVTTKSNVLLHPFGLE